MFDEVSHCFPAFVKNAMLRKQQVLAQHEPSHTRREFMHCSDNPGIDMAGANPAQNRAASDPQAGEDPFLQLVCTGTH